jgi:transposase InsO family protein
VLADESLANGDAAGPASDSWLDALPPQVLAGPRPRPRGRRLAQAAATGQKRTLSAQQRLLLLDSWRRSGLPARDFATLVGISKHTLYGWKKRFDESGPAGLVDQPKGAPKGSRLPELTKRTILMLKQSHPEWGCQRISDMLVRGPALPASASTVARVLHEAGYELVDEPTRPHPQHVQRFERARPNQLWQTDLFTFVLKRHNRRLYLVAFMDDHSRFLVSYGLHASASTALVLEALEAGISCYGPPEEVLTDNGPQYVTWRGKSQFTRRLEQRGIRQLVARPRRPQTLGKIERFWGTLWRELLQTAVFHDLAEARTRIGLFIDYHNFQRVHRGIDGLVPADRYFGAASDVARTLKERVAANALELAQHGQPRAPFYVTGQMEGQAFSVHAEGPRLILTRPGQPRQEVELTPASDAAGAATSPSEPAALPRPVCPEGVPPTGTEDAHEALAGSDLPGGES